MRVRLNLLYNRYNKQSLVIQFLVRIRGRSDVGIDHNLYSCPICHPCGSVSMRFLFLMGFFQNGTHTQTLTFYYRVFKYFCVLTHGRTTYLKHRNGLLGILRGMVGRQSFHVMFLANIISNRNVLGNISTRWYPIKNGIFDEQGKWI